MFRLDAFASLRFAVLVGCCALSCVGARAVSAQQAGTTDAPGTATAKRTVAPVAWSDEKVAAETKRVQADIVKLINCFNTGDVDTMFSLLPPKSIEAMGGIAAGKATVKKVMEKFKQEGIEFAETAAGTPKFLAGPNYEYVVLPTKSRLNHKGNGTSADSFTVQLGMRKRGETNWRFLDGSRMRRMKQDFVPEFPRDYELPEPEDVLAK
jgi:hypothetical protein